MKSYLNIVGFFGLFASLATFCLSDDSNTANFDQVYTKDQPRVVNASALPGMSADSSSKGSPQDQATNPENVTPEQILNPVSTQRININALNKAGIYPLGGQLFVDRNVTVFTLNVTTLTVSGLATVPTGINSTDAAQFGQIFEGLQKEVQVTITASSATTSSSFIPTTLAASIKPTSANNRIEIRTFCQLRTSNPTTDNAYATIYRGTSNLLTSTGFMSLGGTGTSLLSSAIAFTYTDSPSSASSVTYTIEIRSDGGGGTVTLNPTLQTCSLLLREVQ